MDGIVMTALGGLSVLGSFANNYYWNITHNGANMSDFITIGIQIALIAEVCILFANQRNRTKKCKGSNT